MAEISSENKKQGNPTSPNQSRVNTAALSWPPTAELQASAERTAGQKVIFVDNRKEGRKVFERGVRAQGAPEQAIASIMKDFDIQPARVSPPQNGASCVISLQREPGSAPVPPGSLTEQLYRSPQRKELAKLAAMHEGMHCNDFTTLRAFGFAPSRSNETESQRFARANIIEGVPEGKAVIIALRDAYTSKDSKRINETRQLVETLNATRRSQGDERYSLALNLSGRFLRENPTNIAAIPENKIDAYVLKNAKELLGKILEVKFPQGE